MGLGQTQKGAGATDPSVLPAATRSGRAGKVKGQPKRADLLLGATDPIRTGDLLITSELLYLLSHSSIFRTDTVYQVFVHSSRDNFRFLRQ